jgi:hypothetical protein
VTLCVDSLTIVRLSICGSPEIWGMGKFEFSTLFDFGIFKSGLMVSLTVSGLATLIGDFLGE